MVWDPPKQEVNVTGMIIYSIIPFLGIYTGWRIQKFWIITGIQALVGIGLGFALYTFPIESFWIPYFGRLISYIIIIIITIFLTRHFARKYNEKIKSV